MKRSELSGLKRKRKRCCSVKVREFRVMDECWGIRGEV